MRLPEVAARLRELANELNCDELNALAAEIGRRPAGSRAPRTSVPMTEKLKNQIRAMKRENPDLPHTRIAEHFNINPGRVSEALKGKRT
jgi:hypothetical protein